MSDCLTFGEVVRPAQTSPVHGTEPINSQDGGNGGAGLQLAVRSLYTCECFIWVEPAIDSKIACKSMISKTRLFLAHRMLLGAASDSESGMKGESSG